MAKRVAVITDATSAGYVFPCWQRYYAGQFGSRNLHVVTYRGLRSAFDGLGLGEVVELDSLYDDRLRAKVISGKVTALLDDHDIVLRCDVDEFLVADPRRYASLAAYVEALALPSVTAVGLDVVETPGDAPLALEVPLLAQRHLAVPTSSLNKTSIVTRPVTWSPGFHGATVPPHFDDLFLLHIKFADVKGRVAWFTSMRNRVQPGSSEYAYYDDGQRKLESFAAHLNRKPHKDGWEAIEDQDFRQAFLASVTCNPINGIYQGHFKEGDSLVRLPPDLGRGV